MKSAQEIFAGDFSGAKIAVVQKLHANEKNNSAMESGYTENWPPLTKPADVFVLSVGEEAEKKRKIWAGFIDDFEPSEHHEKRFRFNVDRFRFIGEHDLDEVPDAEFYGSGGGGGSRNYITNRSGASKNGTVSNTFDFESGIPEGAMERRLVWVRKNHHRFRDPVWQHWEGRCAVTDAACDGLLIASHIFPWARSTPKEKTDPQNGLLLAAPLDKLFDRGWISFSDSGELLVKKFLSKETRAIFGISKKDLGIDRVEKIGARMKIYLGRHRNFYGLTDTAR